MADVLTSPNGCVSSCFTLNAQEAQRKDLINRLSSLAKTLTSAASRSYGGEVDKSMTKSDTCLSVPADSVNNTTSVNSYYQSFGHMMQKLGEQLRLFYTIFHTDSMSV